MDLDELGFGFAGGVLDEAEIDLGEERLVGFIRDAVERRDGGFGRGAVVRAFGELADEIRARSDEFFDEGGGEEAGRFADAEGDGFAAGGGETV